MNPETKRILLEADEQGHWEFPPSSAPGTAIKEIDAMLPELERILGIKLDVDRNVQDASFLTDVGYLDDRYYDRQKGVGALSYLFSFRFSNFGRMFTLFGSDLDDGGGTKTNVMAAKRYIEDRGFTFVDADELEELYDGKNEPFDNKLTWWVRFFDYL
ncbi:hypothetical protein [Haloferula sp. A504]|uniref:hypothetical protein n=1 Tax=Haloferula sp. A504 TaxID=3373601 RepID=UPI0031BD5D53|nr:hypothetical protein [Verrucomicrobiaceae bacterium E54]